MTDDIYDLAGALRNIDRLLHPEPRTPTDLRKMVEADDERRLAAEITAAQTERLTATVH
jgi:hypothetical protein